MDTPLRRKYEEELKELKTQADTFHKLLNKDPLPRNWYQEFKNLQALARALNETEKMKQTEEDIIKSR
ncbi:MAG: hypothetical protein AB1757_06895 [Acidobacteriota bacterium]